jgi:hypothetical protein
MSGVLNQFGVTNYGDQTNPIEGTIASGGEARGYANPLLAQISTLTYTLSDTVGNVSLTYRLPDGTEITATGTDAGSTDTTHADTIVLAINESDDWANVATASNVAGAVTLEFIHTGFDYEFVSFSTPGAGILTLTTPETQAAGGALFPVARWVVAAANAKDPSIPALAQVDSDTTASDLVGISARPHGQLTNSGNADNTVNVSEAFVAGDMVPVAYDHSIYVTNVGTVASARNGVVNVVIDTAGGQLFGQSRANADGGNTIAVDVRHAYWIDPTQPGQRGRVFLRM